jgi:histidinol phosphatase-like enzyme (inositol monophosphatase family)
MLAAERLEALEDFLIELNRASAAAILPLFRADHDLQDKGRPGAFDPVTAADKGAEAAIRAMVGQVFPEHGFIGEEYGEDRPDAEFVWVVDPIDGTRAFVAGAPVWTTLIGLRWQGKPVLGSIGQPYVGEIFIGHSDRARLLARGSERSLRTRAGASLSSAVIATTDPAGCFDETERPAWDEIWRRSRLARLGLDAYAYAMVADGHIDLVVEPGLKCWDIEAAIPIIEAAGGAVTDWRGAPVGPKPRQVVIAGDPRLLDDVLPLLAPAAA